MSNMKQVVYAGAFGALVAMQGCGTDETAQVTSEGTTTTDPTKNLQQSVDEVVEAAKEEMEHFDSDGAIKKVKSYLKDHHVDLDHITDSKSVESMKTAIQTAFDDAQKNEKFQQVAAEVTTMLKGFVTPADMELADAEQYIKDACAVTKKGDKPVIGSQKEAAKFVKALQVVHDQRIQGQEYSSEVTTMFGQCKAGMKWQLPCLKTQYKSVTESEIKTKQGYVTPAADAKGAAAKKASKTKSIYDVMPLDFKDCKEVSEVLTYIASEVNNDVKVQKQVLMALAQGIEKCNLLHKKPTAAVKGGKKVAEEAKKEVEKVASDASNASASTNASNTTA